MRANSWVLLADWIKFLSFWINFLWQIESKFDAMNCYTKDQRILIVKTFYKCEKSYIRTIRSLQGILGRRNVPNETTIRRLIKKFEESGSVMDMHSSVHKCSVRSPQKIDAVRRSVAADPTTSLRHRSQQLGMARSTLHTVLKKDLHLYPFKIQVA